MSSKNGQESASEAKNALRARAVKRRKTTVGDSAAVCRYLEPFLVSNLNQGSGVVVVYDALKGEIDLGSLWDPKKRQSEPAISYAITRTPETDMDLTVHLVSAELELHRWGYRQPVAGTHEVDLSEIAAVLVPALAFDLSGGRIGWGAGYYDRLLARIRPDALKIGISDGFIVDKVPTDAHDVAMTHIATPSGVISV